ncbi:MAG: NAD-dependent epimerase/dehydratase family protein, partial [Pseudoxanthomonas sp.]
MRDALVFGGSGQIGVPVIERLRSSGWNVIAVSRTAQVDGGQLRWLRGDLRQVAALPPRVDAILSLGPLDHFARWYAETSVATSRVVA